VILFPMLFPWNQLKQANRKFSSAGLTFYGAGRIKEE
jgi:hypothetical protein